VDSSTPYRQLYIGEACSAFFFGVIIGKLTFFWALGILCALHGLGD